VGAINIHKLKGARPLFVEKNGRLWVGRGTKIFVRENGSLLEQFVGAYKGGMTDKLSGFSRLAARFFRTGYKLLQILPDGSILVLIRGCLLKLKEGERVFKPVFKLPRGSGPLSICLTPQGKLYFGEYFFNEKKSEVYIYYSADFGETWHVKFTFPAGDIRHVHGIVYDKYRNGCWVMTGDDDSESRIGFSSDGFETIDVVFSGKQCFRIVTLIPEKKMLITATDTPFEKNYIQILNPEKNVVTKVQEITGSVFNMQRVGEYFVVSVVVEPSKVNNSRYASIWVSKNGFDWTELYRQKKDKWQIPYNFIIPDYISELPFFQHGEFVLPKGNTDKSCLSVYGQALVDDDDYMISWDLNNDWC